jgi:hypothetical protein
VRPRGGPGGGAHVGGDKVARREVEEGGSGLRRWKRRRGGAQQGVGSGGRERTAAPTHRLGACPLGQVRARADGWALATFRAAQATDMRARPQ